MSDPMDEMTERQRRAEALANAQIPGLAQEEPAAAQAPARDVLDVSGAPAGAPTQEEIERITEDVVAALKTVYDPEIPTDIYELGLIYKVDLNDDRRLDVTMTLTAPGCPVAGEMPIWVRDACARVEGVREVEVDLVFDPPWTPDRMSEEARLELNML